MGGWALSYTQIRNTAMTNAAKTLSALTEKAISMQTSQSGVAVTDRAIARVGEIIAAKADGSRALRVSVEGGGCSGFSYKFDLVREPQPDDIVVGPDSAAVVIDPVSLMYMEGSTIDFVDDLIGQSFQVDNPNATASCGCGTSFSI